MIKNIFFTLLATFLMVGCGGGSSTDQGAVTSSTDQATVDNGDMVKSDSAP